MQGHVAELVLLVMVAEGFWLVCRRNWPVATATLRLLPGALMIVALGAALRGAAWPWSAIALALSFPVHLADLRRR